MPKSGDGLAQIAGSEEHIVRDDSVEKELLRLWLLNLLLELRVKLNGLGCTHWDNVGFILGLIFG